MYFLSIIQRMNDQTIKGHDDLVLAPLPEFCAITEILQPAC